MVSFYYEIHSAMTPLVNDRSAIGKDRLSNRRKSKRNVEGTFRPSLAFALLVVAVPSTGFYGVDADTARNYNDYPLKMDLRGKPKEQNMSLTRPDVLSIFTEQIGQVSRAMRTRADSNDLIQKPPVQEALAVVNNHICRGWEVSRNYLTKVESAERIHNVRIPDVLSLCNKHFQRGRKISRELRSRVESVAVLICSPQMRDKWDVSTALHTRAGSTMSKARLVDNVGFYYGLQENTLRDFSTATSSHSYLSLRAARRKQRELAIRKARRDTIRKRRQGAPPVVSNQDAQALADVMGETLRELREMREDIAYLRDEMRVMKMKMDGRSVSFDEEEDEDLDVDESQGILVEKEIGGKEERMELGSLLGRRNRAKEFDKIGTEVEEWAKNILHREGEEEGWQEISCNKFVRKKFNRAGTTTCYLKWMKDSRGRFSKPDDDEKEYPCLKCFATINAPLDDVCTYLSQEIRIQEYNDLIEGNRDLEEITPHSKICWSQCPQILFVKPRDFVTFCHHRWGKDGGQIMVNQACEHPSSPGVASEKDGNVCRAYALRGANFLSVDPDDPNKTKFSMVCHADPGGGLPTWVRDSI